MAKEERNLCDACKDCKNRTRSWVICLEECGYVIDALDRIESERATSEKVLGNAPTDMTREEAIARIQEHMIAHKMKEPRAILVSKALDMAVNALKQATCEDAISRADANKLVDELARAIDDQNRHYPKRGRDIAIIARDIERLPRVTPIREHGKWIRVDDTKCKCSKCEITHFIAQYPHGKVDFCPNCGADMRKEQNNV